MRVRALQPFTLEQSAHVTGDVLEMADNLAEIRITSGLVARVGAAPVETATEREPETAVSRPTKRPRK